MALKSNSRNMILSLSAVCLVCAGILSLVYNLTYDTIRQAEKNKLNEALAVVLPEGSEICGEAQTLEDGDGLEYECYKASAPSGEEAWAVVSSVNGFSGPVVVLVGICGSKVCSSRVLSQSETPGLGAECVKPAFSSQFDSAGISDAILKKDGGSVDAITGATITSRAYAKAVSNALKLIMERYE